jgi:hypothetical protein
MALKNPVLFWLLIVFGFVNLVDAVTAYFILPGEANPLFILTGSIIVVDILKIGFVGLMFYYYHRNIYPTEFNLFVLVMILVLGSLVVGMAAWGNIQGIIHPEIVEQTSVIPKGEKIQAYFSFVTIFYFMPFAVTLIAFKLYQYIRKDANIDKQYFKKLKWWHL